MENIGWKFEVGLFVKEENMRDEKIEWIKMKMGPIIFYPLNIRRKI